MARLTRCSAKYTADCRGKTPSIAGFLQYLFGIRADLLLYGLKARRIAQLREAATNFFNLAKLILAYIGKNIAFEWHNHCGLS